MATGTVFLGTDTLNTKVGLGGVPPSNPRGVRAGVWSYTRYLSGSSARTGMSTHRWHSGHIGVYINKKIKKYIDR